MHVGIVIPYAHFLNVRANALLKMLPILAEQVEITLIAPDDPGSRELARNLKLRDFIVFPELRVGHKTLAYFTDLHPPLRHAVNKVRDDVDLFHVPNPWGVNAVAASGVPTIHHSNNVEGEFVFHHYGFPKAALPILYPILNLQEKMACQRAKLTVTVSPDDLEELHRRYSIPKNRLRVIPPGLDLTGTYPSKRQARLNLGLEDETVYLLFHGNWNHRPNRLAFDLLNGPIAKWLDRNLPGVKLLLAGPGVVERDAGNIKSLGFVKDLRDLTAAADVALAPLTIGGGVRVKLIDYLAGSLPMVLTDIAAKGLRLKNGHEALITTNSAEFLGATKKLVEDEDLRISMAKAARQVAERDHDLDKVCQQLIDLWADVI